MFAHVELEFVHPLVVLDDELRAFLRERRAVLLRLLARHDPRLDVTPPLRDANFPLSSKFEA